MDTSTAESPRAVIIGGGLAGMVIANALRDQDIPVLILEQSGRMGGKAGADKKNGVFEEHGYHVFPAWYANTDKLIREIGVSDDLVPITRFHYLVDPEQSGGPKNGRGIYPDTIQFYQLDSVRNYFRNIFSGLIPWYEALLSFYAVLDLISQSWTPKRFLDRVSVNGFLRSRYYASDTIATYNQQTVLQASAIPNFELSAMTLRNLVLNWCVAPTPLFRIFNGNLQEKFIAPLERMIGDKGCLVRMNTSVEELVVQNNRIAELRLKVEARAETEYLEPGDICVITTPLEVTRTFIKDDIFNCEERNTSNRGPEEAGRLCQVNYLESAPMAAFHCYLKEKIADIPREHVNLYGSRYGLSFIDVSKTWQGMDNSCLSIIASDFKHLVGLSEDEAWSCVLEDLEKFVPGIGKVVDRVHKELNTEAPLFLNTVGSWRCRPRSRTRICNLYIAGDYCRSDADLTTMESAVISAGQTAAAALEDLGKNPERARPESLKKPCIIMYKIAKWVLFPAAIALRILINIFAEGKSWEEGPGEDATARARATPDGGA